MNKTTKIILAIIVAAIVVGGGGYYYQTKNTVSDKITTSPITNTQPKSEKEPTITSNWQNYRNGKLGFQIKYPQDWIYAEFDSGIYFGTPESVSGGYIWGISIHQPSELEKIISQMGSQFVDRKESRSEVIVNKNITGTMVAVTTNKYHNWTNKTVYFENNGQLFSIGNGATDDERFESFYKSFEAVADDDKQ